MKKSNRNKFYKGRVKDFAQTQGYFIGRFMGEKGKPFLETNEVEIAWKTLPTTFKEKAPHYHKRGVEINIVVNGKYRAWVEGEELELVKGDFLVVYPEAKLRNISADKETELIVVKAPSIANDKFDA